MGKIADGSHFSGGQVLVLVQSRSNLDPETRNQNILCHGWRQACVKIETVLQSESKSSCNILDLFFQISGCKMLEHGRGCVWVPGGGEEVAL